MVEQRAAAQASAKRERRRAGMSAANADASNHYAFKCVSDIIITIVLDRLVDNGATVAQIHQLVDIDASARSAAFFGMTHLSLLLFAGANIKDSILFTCL